MKRKPAYRTRTRQNGPVTLSPAEIENPHKVLKEFFSAYTLTDIRIFLRERECESIDIAGTLVLVRQLERLIEAAWVLRTKKKQ